MWNSIVALLLGLFAEVAPWDPASLNPMPVRISRPAALPAEPSTLVLALIGLGIFATYAGIQRWRRVQPTKPASVLRTRESVPEPRKRDAA
jgi:hypothetical protein